MPTPDRPVLHVRIDSQEQHPLFLTDDGVRAFRGLPVDQPVPPKYIDPEWRQYVCATRGHLPVFDYALEDDPRRWAVERKSLNDFVESMVSRSNWKANRFGHELQKIHKANPFLPIVYVVECSRDDIATGYSYEGRKFTPQWIRSQAASLIFQNVHVYFAGDREHAAQDVWLLLRQRYKWLRLQDQLRKAGKAGKASNGP